MAADVFGMLVDILKINQNQVAEYAAQGPLYQLFYLLFFPTVFIVIFVWILSHAVIGEQKALRILLSIGVYAFIILQGLYNWFVMLSKFWLFGLMFLGFIYFIAYRGGRGGGGVHGKTIGGGGVMDKLSSRLTMKITGQEKQLYDRIEADLRKLEQSKGSEDYGRIYIHVEEELKNLEGLVRSTDVTGMGFAVGGKKYKQLMERFMHLPTPSRK
ncbi:MAG: hypothetical protein V1648_04870 [Candidatus Aenigmatarchaeota archaeon]